MANLTKRNVNSNILSMKKNYYTFMRCFLTLLFFFSILGIQAQDIMVSGVVSDSTEDFTMVGVNIVQKGATKGTTTDINGKYSITVVKGSVLVFSFIGYNSVEVVVNQPLVNIKMQTSATMLDEVITIGYATQKKSDKTGAVSHVKAEDLNAGSLTDPIQAMQGKVAGVLVTKKGGDPNSGFSVRIRGASGFMSNTQPLYVVDGVPGVDPTLIAPEDIESYNILKDAASTAIYGSRGSNGVILITTKKGSFGQGARAGVSRVNFSSQVSFDKVAKKLKVLSAEEMRAHAQTLLVKAQASNPNLTIDSIFTDGGASTDWQDEIYRLGISNTNNISFSGGSNNSNYYASLTSANWNGVMKGTSKDRYIARLNFQHAALNDKLIFNVNATKSFENNDYENYSSYNKDDIIYQAISRNPTDPVYNADGSYNKANRVFNYENPISIINEVQNIRNTQNFIGNLKTDYIILPGLVASLNLGYMANTFVSSYFRPSGLYASADNGFGKKQNEGSRQQLVEFTVNYDKTINVNHNFNFLGGYSYQKSIYDGFYAQGGDAQSDFVGFNNLSIFNEVVYGDIGSWKGEWTLAGFFGRAQYNYKQKYYGSASLRYDGSSKFGENNKWGMFPTVALGWTINKEDFMKNINWINQLKLRASYGVSGNQEIGEYRSQVVWVPSGKATNPETGEEVITFKPAWNANPDLKWEETAELNFGIDFSIFGDKLSGSFEIYKKNTTDLLGEYTVPVPPNLAPKTFANSGELENKGVELFLQAYPINTKNISWKTGLNLSHNKTTIVSLGEYFNSVDGVRKEGYINGRGLIGEEYYIIGMMEGEQLGAFYLPTYVTLDQDGEFVYQSKTGGFTKNLSEAQRSIVGNATPDLEIGWSNTITLYKNWTIDFAFRAMIGNDIYNATEMFFDNPSNLPSLNATQSAIEWYNDGRSSSASLADLYVEDASFLRLDYFSVAYNFKLKSTNLVKALTVFVSSNNLFTITGYSGIDPETTINGLSFGIDQFNVYPKTRTLTIGIKGTL